MRVLLVTTGSHGDINPFIAIGRALRERGHDAVLMTNPYYQGQVEEAGLGFLGVGEFLDLKRVHETIPDLMHERKGVRVVLDLIIGKFAGDAYRAVRAQLQSGAFDVVVHHHIAIGAAWAAEELGVPTASTVLAPMMWMSRGDLFTPQSWSSVYPSRVLLWLIHTLKGPILRRLMDPIINSARREIGLRKAKGEYLRITRGGTINLGMWSPALRRPLADDPPQSVICGFPWHDRHGEQENAGEQLEAFLAQGEPPILFTLGTAAVHVAGDFFEHAAEACRILGRRGLLLVGPGRPMPKNLPAGSLAVEYARFSAVMPRCAVNIHHGGIGSTGQGLRAGRPTVVIPHAHDQFDNAARLKRLGISETLPRPKVTAARLATAIRTVLGNQSAERAAHSAATGVRPESGADRAAVAIEQMVAQQTDTKINK
jgi:UDP:flavonoid glycosyltransferase YjiC (YdhE family)